MLDEKYWMPNKNTPRLFLAPMEGTVNSTFRKVYSENIGGFDEASTEFLRVPDNANTYSLAKKYDSQELTLIPLAAQIMGRDVELMASMAQHLEKRGAPRIDINCACPSKTVNKGKTGAYLLKDPEKIFQIVTAVRKNISIPLSVKIRLGYDDTTMFDEILHAIENGGANFVIVHARTKSMGYSGKADWSKIKTAKKTVTIPVIGNGDILTAEDAKKMHKESGCDGIMIGRGALRDPWIFHKIKAKFNEKEFSVDRKKSRTFLKEFYSAFKTTLHEKALLNRLKSASFYLLADYNDINILLSRKDLNSESFYKELERLWLASI